MKEIKYRQRIAGAFHFWGIIGNDFVSPMAIGEENFQNTIHDEYTGLKDKNGKEIYEEDIISLNGGADPFNCEVMFEYGCFCAKVFWIDPTIKNTLNLPKGYPELKHYIEMPFCTAEIIGNRHENPELLEAGNGDN